MKRGKRMGWKGRGLILIAEQLFRSLLDKYPPGFPRVRCCVSSKNKFQSFEGNALLSLVPTTLLYPRIFFSRFDDPPFSLSALFISLSLSLSGTGVPLEETGKPTILRGNKRQETSVYASDFCHDNSTESDVSTVYRNIDLPHFLFSSIELSPRRFE